MLEQDVNGVPHVLVPKDVWDDIMIVFDEIKNNNYGDDISS